MQISKFDFINNYKNSLPAYIVMGGIDYPQPGISRDNGFSHYQWIQTQSGSGFLEFGGNVKKVGPNQGFLLPPYEQHAYYPSQEGWNQNWIAFNGCMLPDIIKTSRLKFFEVYDLKTPALISSKIKKAVLSGARDMSELELCVLIFDILADLSKITDNSAELHNSRLESAIGFMYENCAGSISIEDISGASNITPQHLCHLFKKHLNLKPFEYLNKIRINKSKSLLLQTPSMKVKDIASLCGFNSTAYFCTAFKKIEGCTPEEFKKMNRI